MNIKPLVVAALGLLTLSPSLMAVAIVPYGSPGTTNAATYTFTAVGNGPVTAYFVGQTAAYGSMVGLSINGAAPAIFGLQNHIALPGASLVLGNVIAGDILRFQLAVNTTGPSGPPPTTYTLNSDKTLNPGGVQHIYSYAYAGDIGLGLPAGTYVGFEDISPITGGDRDYDDHQFIFTGPGLSKTPDGGATILMLGMTIAGLGYLRRKFYR